MTERRPDPARPLHIIHLDMDAFFASVEIRDNPALRGKPVIIGGSPHSRGVVSTCSYEARRYGVHSALPAAEAYRRCPHGIFLRPNMAKYAAVSAEIRAVMARYTDLIEPLSLDEAYLDVAPHDAVAIGRDLKETIARELQLTASVGVSYNKFLAKLASDWEKPDGFTVFTPERAAALLPTLPVRKLWGVGPRTEELLRSHGLETAGDLLQADPAVLDRLLGRRAAELLALARGEDDRPVVPHREAKSIGEENTFASDIADEAWLQQQLAAYAAKLAGQLQRRRLLARTVTVKVKFPNFRLTSRSVTGQQPTDAADRLTEWALLAFARLQLGGRPVRLLGLTVSGLVSRNEIVQLTLFD